MQSPTHIFCTTPLALTMCFHDLLIFFMLRRITSLFRLSARMISRDAFTQSILVLFQLFVPPSKLEVEESNGSDEAEKKTGHVELGAVLSKDSSLSQLTPSKVNPAPTGTGTGGGLLLDLSAQVSAGMWRVLTNNLEVLPTLSLSQWQIIFDVIGTQVHRITCIMYVIFIVSALHRDLLRYPYLICPAFIV